MSKLKLLIVRNCNFELCLGLGAKVNSRLHFNFKWPEMKLEVEVRKLVRPNLNLLVLHATEWKKAAAVQRFESGS